MEVMVARGGDRQIEMSAEMDLSQAQVMRQYDTGQNGKRETRDSVQQSGRETASWRENETGGHTRRERTGGVWAWAAHASV